MVGGIFASCELFERIIIIAMVIIWVRKSETRLTRSAAVKIVISVDIIKKNHIITIIIIIRLINDLDLFKYTRYRYVYYTYHIGICVYYTAGQV